MKDLGLGWKLAGCCALIVVLAGGAAFIGERRQATASEMAGRFIDIEVRKSNLIRDVLAAAQDNARSTLELLLISDPAGQSTIRASIEATRKRNAETIAALDQLLVGDDETKRRFGEVQALRKAYIDLRTRALDQLQKQKDREGAMQIWVKEATPALANYRAATENLLAERGAASATLVASVRAAMADARSTMILGMGVALLAGVALVSLIVAGIVRRLRRAVEMANAIASGRLDSELPARSSDEVGELLFALGAMQDQLKARAVADQKQLLENGRIKKALDSSALPVRICDAEGRVVYANPTLLATVARLEREIQKTAPNFRAATFVGSSIGELYADPAGALARLRQLTETRTTVMNIGGRDFEVVTTPMVGPGGERIGTIGQWVDRTDELRAEREIGEVVRGATQGDFGRRLDVAGKQGFQRQVAEQLNQIMVTCEAAVREVVKTLAAMAHGDLTVRVSGQYSGLFDELKRNANDTIAELTNAIGQIDEAAAAINSGASEIARGNLDLSNRTESQASSLQATASAIEELTSTVRQNAENAKQASKLAMGASAIAERGGDTVDRVVATMSDIAASSKRIEDIISVIDGIAFQTNILALNAAVEAARAGEQGRGFAVVAAEVRNLAQRSAAAAREIKELITASVGRVDAGSALVQEAGGTMVEIVQAVKRVSDIVEAITAASLEQSAGIEQVNQAVTKMDQMTQQNAALVEEAAAAAASLENEADHLEQAVGRFKVAGSNKAMRSSRGAPRSAPSPDVLAIHA